MKKRIPPLLIEHKDELANLHLLSVVEYQRQEHICIIDNITTTELRVFTLNNEYDETLSQSKLMSEAIHWFYSASHKHQLSIQLAMKGLTPLIGPLYKRFDLTNVSRVVGKVFHYPELSKVKIKRKKVIPLPEGIEIHFKKN